MLAATAFVTIAALNIAVGSVNVSATVPLLCQDYQVGDKIVAQCNDEPSIAPPAGGVPIGQPRPPGVKPLANVIAAPANARPAPVFIVAPRPAAQNSTLCIGCTFY